MIVWTDATGLVRLASSGQDTSDKPMQWNGLLLTSFAIDDKVWEGMPADRSGVTFDGTKLTALPAQVQPQVTDPMAAVQNLKQQLVALGVPVNGAVAASAAAADIPA